MAGDQETDYRIFIHRINSEDKITYVNSDWLAFAAENGAGDLSFNTVLDKPLWNFISDPQTRYLYQIILEKVRTAQVELQIPNRCDSPDCRRFMEMKIQTPFEGIAEFSSRILKLEKRVYLKLLDRRVDRSTEFLKMCGWCKKVSVRSKWLEVEEAIGHLDLFEALKLPQLTHTICPVCFERTKQSLQ